MARYTETRSNCIVGDLYRNHGHKTRDAGSSKCVKDAEEAFWRIHGWQRSLLTQDDDGIESQRGLRAKLAQHQAGSAPVPLP